MRSNPPKWAIHFFRSFCNDHLREAVLGDLLELYDRRSIKYGKHRANLLFVWNVLQFIQPFAIQKKYSSLNNTAMLRNYFVIAWRSMSRQKMYAGIKIGGFALGLATCITIFLYVRDEVSFDENHPDQSQLYRLYNDHQGGNGGKWTSFPAPTASIVKDEYPEVEVAARLIPYNGWFNAGSNLFRRDDRTDNTYEEKFAYADQSLLDILNIPFVYGNPKQALAKPNSIVISRSRAETLFPGEDPTGKIVILNEDASQPYSIGGVMEDLPKTSHLQYNFFISLTNVEFWPGEQTSWCCWNYNIYLKLKPHTSPAEFEKKLLKVRDNHYVTYLRKNGDAQVEEIQKNYFIRLQPIADVYLKSQGIGGANDDSFRVGDERYVWLFSAIAIFILVLACINFINLSTAKSANRAKEVGLRKVVGSVRSYLVRQFLTESILYSLLSFALALIIVFFTLPFFNQLAGKSLALPWNTLWFIPGLLVAVLLVGLLAGIYPSFYLSAFNPIDVLKGAVSRGSRRSGLRSTLVVFQFTTSIALIVGTAVIYRQMNYILNTKLGFDKDQVITIQGTNTLGNQQASFKDELKRLAGVENVTINSYLPVASKRDQNQFWKEGRSKIDVSIGAQNWRVDEDYIGTMGMKLIEGRNFDPALKSDTGSIIINQTMARELGLEHPIGARVQNWQGWTVIGVVEDFHFESMRDKIGALSFVYGNGGPITSVKVKTTDMQAMLASIHKTWTRFMPHQPFRYTFLDQSFAHMYDDVRRAGKIFATFAFLAIAVACLGLFALSSFLVEQRKKEISIRIVLGAPFENVLRLLTQNFVVLVAISFVVAIPLSWFGMQKWLNEFQYKIPMTWDLFAIAGGLALLIALGTVSYQSVQAAMTNPAKNLRSE